VVSPSSFDAAPGILFEASAMGCNVVASKNCGNWMLCNTALLVNRYDAKSFVSKIELSLSQKYPDNFDYFAALQSYQNLVETILVF